MNEQSDQEKVSRELVSSCCSWPVADLAGNGVGGLDVCQECGEWCTIESLDEEEGEK